MADRDAAFEDLVKELEEAGFLERYTNDDGQQAVRVMRDGTRESLPEGRCLEMSALLRFICAYRRQVDGFITPIEMPLPPEPDFICRVGDSRLVGVEIAHLYGSERDARMTLGRAQPDERTDAVRVQHARVPLSDRIPADLDRILLQKCERVYPRTCWLVIRNAYPLWTSDDFVRYALPWEPRGTVPFEQVWLIADRDGSSGLLQLYA